MYFKYICSTVHMNDKGNSVNNYMGGYVRKQSISSLSTMRFPLTEIWGIIAQFWGIVDCLPSMINLSELIMRSLLPIRTITMPFKSVHEPLHAAPLLAPRLHTTQVVANFEYGDDAIHATNSHLSALIPLPC